MPSHPSRPLRPVLICALVALAAALGYWLGARSPRASAAASAPAPAHTNAPDAATGTPRTALSASNDPASSAAAATRSAKPEGAAFYQQMLAALNEPISTERWLMLASVLQGLSPDNWRSAFQALDDERRLHGKEHGDARSFLVRRAGEVVGVAAIAYLLEQKDRSAVGSALTGWASKEPTAALEWLAKQSERDRATFAGAAIRGLSLAEPDLAIAYLEQTPLAERARYTPNLLATIERTAGLEQTQRLVDGMIDRARAAGTLDARYLTDVFRDLAEIKVRRAHVTGNVDAGIAWIDQHIGQPYVNYEAVRNSVGQLTRSDPLKALAWIDSVNTRATFPASITPVGYGTLLSTWISQAGPETVGRWLQSNPQHVAYDRMAAYYSDMAGPKNAQLAGQVAAAMKDPAARSATLAKVQRTTPTKK